MAQTKPQPSDDENSPVTQSDERTDQQDPQTCNETVAPETRREILSTYNHRCQSCGRYGPEGGGLATLHVHHLDRDVEGMDEHDPENLSLLCRSCHSWLHQQSTPADSPVDLTDADQSVLLPQDIEILQYLERNGPQRTGDITAGLPTELSVSAVRERLWVLMGLDNRVDDRDEQVVDKDVETGEWGLTSQIENSVRGDIPDDPQLLLQRMEDELVRQALDRDCDRSAVEAVLGVSRRTTFNKAKRAYAYDFPLDAFSRGGRPSKDASQEGEPSLTDAHVETDEQQRLDTVCESDETAESDGSDDADSAESSRNGEESGDERTSLTDESQESNIQTKLEILIQAMEEIRTDL
ncbi:HNH endonuclease signature motif containing protein [Halomicroarcula sp. GCM10025709]|uniref:HNH endonuclease n=1 Tax=Haloarcula TaxID=2237 RepID=UPI0024C3E16D|nr:HNH endonuclease signature motif containing protein [Halomicroarcula sp. YJ-61-S]